ncbi:hypothetical protein ACFLZN_00630 [Nanoarchaeota archaeon]
MRVLKDKEAAEAEVFLHKAADLAKQATCQRSQCASIIVNNGVVIGTGVNTPPMELESQRRCKNSKSDYNIKITDKTCCIHAEQRAIMDALRNNPDKIRGSRLYFFRLKNGIRTKAGKPYCTICSKMALDVGIIEFVLDHDEGIYVYDTQEYNDLSHEYLDE